ncbi:uncharacterized protein LOC118740145 [Rhagoletis pomonella]|uniref:uncharacterized protein LOC118740145 n=1 Tax=Rhagoletis pomonella TaxID=28610 RepID=UPI001782DDA6|nr:uncharacterized protein LOC118740145 [Rhagoletis pomonella]
MVIVQYAESNGMGLIVGCDANSQNTIWGSTKCNFRGNKLLDYILSSELVIQNVGNKPTFVTSRRQEAIDLTLTNVVMADHIKGWPRHSKPLSLNEIIDELEKLDDETPFPRNITIFPPDNANAEITDEDSGDEEIVTLNNLPGSQLRASAEIEYMSSDSDDDDVPLCSLAKRSRTTEEPITEERQTEPSTSSSAPIISRPSAVPFVDPTVPNNEKYIWRNRHNPRDQLEWQENQGPRYPQTPVYYFDCMFGDGVIDLLVTYTNIYATQKNKVGNVTSSEMKCFLGILLYSGYIVVPRRYIYWDKSSDTDFSIVYNAMSRDRFTFIMTHLHCCDNTQIATESDKFAKMRPLFNILNEIFLNMAPLEEVYSIDEAMVPYYGGHSCKQFIRGKPIRWGYKFWVGATRLGYSLGKSLEQQTGVYSFPAICRNQNGVLIPMPGSCAGFFICVDGHAIASSCGGFYHFNARTGLCDHPLKVGCSSNNPPIENAISATTSAITKLVARPSLPKPKSPNEVIADLSAGAICNDLPTGILLPKSNSCTQYYVCIYQRPYRRTCPPMLHFNATRGLCQDPTMARCVIPFDLNKLDRQPNGKTETVNDFEKGKLTKVAISTDIDDSHVDNICASSNDGTLLPYAGDCTRFIFCMRGQVLSLFCPEGYHFSPRNAHCEWPSIAECAGLSR